MGLAVTAVAVVVVGLSAASTMSRGDSKQPTRSGQPEKTAKDLQPVAKVSAKRTQKQWNSPAVTTNDHSQRAKEVESYWTEERMDDAQPMEKTHPGGAPSSSPAPFGSSATGSAPAKARTSEKSRNKTSKAAASTGVVSVPAATPSPDYWDDEAMAGAQPLDKTRPGGSGSGSRDQGGTTAPGSPPP